MSRRIPKVMLLLRPKRRWVQLSLRTLFVVVTVLCTALSMWVVPAERRRRALAAIESCGFVEYGKDEEVVQTGMAAFPKPFLRRWLPRVYLNEVQEVYLYDNGKVGGTDAALVHVHELVGLRLLSLSDNTQVTDSQLARLQSLTGLRELSLIRTRVTDAGLTHLQGLTGLRDLSLIDTQITDAGLAHLQGLTGLKELDLGGTRVTDAGLVHLHGLTNLQCLSLDGTHVTNAGLAELRGLTKLQLLGLDVMQIMGAGVVSLQQALPNLEVFIRY